MTFDAIAASVGEVLVVVAVLAGGQACDVPVMNVVETARTSVNTAAPTALRVHRRTFNRTIVDWPNMAQRLVKKSSSTNFAEMAD